MNLFFIFSTVFILVSCQELQQENHTAADSESPILSHETFDRILADESLHIDRYNENYKPIEFLQKRMLNVGDSIRVFGGEKKYLENNFGCKTCDGVITEILFSIETGQIAFIAFNDNRIKDDLYALSIYYLDSKRGYKEGKLYIWERMPTANEIKEVPYDLSFLAKHIIIDQNIGFNLIVKL